MTEAALPGFKEEVEKAGATTKRGYAVDEVKSALQLAIRRGDEEAAAWWTKELMESGLARVAWRRLQVISAEDVAGMIPSLFVDAMARFASMQVGEEVFFAVAAAIQLARARGDRTADDLLSWFEEKERREGYRPKIPNAALDEHTRKGRMLGRGRAHYWHIKTQLVRAADDYPTKYRAKMREWFPLNGDEGGEG